MTTSTPAIAVIDGKLCRLRRTGTVASSHEPLATSVLEFRQTPTRLYVRELPYGLLPGIPNLYCLDPDFRMLWIAEWPLPNDPCGKIVEDTDDLLVTESVTGATIRIDAGTGRVIEVQERHPAAAQPAN